MSETIRFIGRAEVARLFQVSPATVARWATQGKLPYSVTLGGRRRYAREKILALLRDLDVPRPVARRRETRSRRAPSR